MVNAIAGGGTLLTFPALLAFGTPPVIANATSTVALVLGTAGSFFGYRKQIAEVRPWLRWFAPVSLLGGLLGGILLTSTRESIFAALVPFLLLFATLLFLGQGTVRRLAGFGDAVGKAPGRHSRALGLAVGFQFLVALYGGYFGAGIGILMLASLALLGLTDIHQMNGLKTVLGSLINLVAALWFVAAGLVDWPRAAVMAAAALAGYYLGSHGAQRIPQRVVRLLITTIGFGISGWLFYRRFAL
jgi:uncharacterized membrane protein YfcA